MAVLTFEGQRFALAAGESVLDCLLCNGQPIQHSCKAGLCQWCADADITVKLPGAAAAAVDSLVCELTLLNAAVMKLVLKPADAASLDCKPGQYMNLTNPAGCSKAQPWAMQYHCAAPPAVASTCLMPGRTIPFCCRLSVPDWRRCSASSTMRWHKGIADR